MINQKYMELAIELAKKGSGLVSPNPMVGAVIVKNNEIVSQGFHRKYGELHAERDALKSCNYRAPEADLYVTLEPCCHHGKQPPCTDAIIASGIKRVIIGSSDPNPLVAGKGVSILRNAGIEVIENYMKDECDELNKDFFHFIKTGMPYVIMKYAMTLDGKIATYSGESKWITGEEARKNVHEDRRRYSAIMVGIGTVLKDNPMLTCRTDEAINPVRVICDTNLRIPMDSNIVKTSKDIATIIATSSDDTRKISSLEASGCTILKLPKADEHIDLKSLMKQLGEMKISSLILEGGGRLNWSAIDAGIVCKVQAYIAPKLFGGISSPSPIGGQGIKLPADTMKLTTPIIRTFGNDIMVECEVIK